MKRKIVLFLLAFCLLIAGCSAVLNHSNDSIDATERNTSTTSSETAIGSNETPSENGGLSNLEEQYINSGQGFAALVGDQLQRHDQTRLLDSEAHPNNTIDLTIQLRGDRSLYWSMMDGTQSIAAVTFHATVDSENLPRNNGTVQRLHEPDRVNVFVQDSEGNPIGSFSVDPGMARQYRLNRISETDFANNVANSLERVREYDLGEVQPSHYLNRSELTIWARDYAQEARNWSEDQFLRPFPIDNLKTNSSSHEILHEFNWSMEKYGQASISASATAYTAYWRTTDKSWAMAPQRLNVYIHRTNSEEDYIGHMERRWVYALLDTNRNSTNLTEYMDKEEWQYINEDESPLEDEF